MGFKKEWGSKNLAAVNSVRRFLRRSIWWLFHRRQANSAAFTSSFGIDTTSTFGGSWLLRRAFDVALATHPTNVYCCGRVLG